METPDVPEAAPQPEPIPAEEVGAEPIVPTDDVEVPLEEDQEGVA